MKGSAPTPSAREAGIGLSTRDPFASRFSGIWRAKTHEIHPLRRRTGRTLVFFSKPVNSGLAQNGGIQPIVPRFLKVVANCSIGQITADCNFLS